MSDLPVIDAKLPVIAPRFTSEVLLVDRAQPFELARGVVLGVSPGVVRPRGEPPFRTSGRGVGSWRSALEASIDGRELARIWLARPGHH